MHDNTPIRTVIFEIPMLYRSESDNPERWSNETPRVQNVERTSSTSPISINLPRESFSKNSSMFVGTSNDYELT